MRDPARTLIKQGSRAVKDSFPKKSARCPTSAVADF